MIMSKAGFAARHVDHSWVMSRGTFNIAKCVRIKPMNQNDTKHVAEGLSKNMRVLLGKICDSNGGGVRHWSSHTLTVQALFDRGLIQGKRGQLHCMVHTREGLEVRKHLKGYQP
jgi:hypothetical protein